MARAKTSKKKTSASVPFEWVGSVVNPSHPATPVVVGDLALMRGWGGDAHGSHEGELVDVEIASGEGRVYVPELDLRAPAIFRRGADEVWLLVSEEDNYDLTDEYAETELAEALGRPFPAPADDEYGDRVVIDVTSGAIAVALAYEPAKLPASAPKEPLVERECVVVPVEPGPYEVVIVTTDKWIRARMRKVSDAERAAFEEELGKHDDDDDDVIVPATRAHADNDLLEKEPDGVVSLVIQSEWPATVARREGGRIGARLRVPSTSSLPDIFGELVNLEVLHVEGAFAGVLPPSIGACTRVRELKMDLWETALELPASLAKLEGLEALWLPKSLRTLPGGLRYAKLKKLVIPFGVLVDHRADLAALTSLEELEVVATARPGERNAWDRSDRDLPRGELPAEIAELRSLRRLSLSRVGAETLSVLERLPNLQSIALWCTRTTTVLDLVRRAPALTDVTLTGTRVSSWEERTIAGLLALAPAERASAAPASKKKTPVTPGEMRRMYIEGWDAIASFAVSADGKVIVAGERGGHRVCAWDAASGTLLWERTLFDVHLIDANVHVAFDADGKLVAGATTFEGHLFWLALADGAVEREKQIGSGGVSGAFYEHMVLDRTSPKLIALAQLGGMTSSGPCAVYTYPDIKGVGHLPGAPGVTSRDGEAFTIDRGNDIVIMTAGAMRGRAGIPRGGLPHAFTPDGKKLVLIGEELEAFVHDAATGKENARFCWDPEGKELPPRKRPEPAWPVFDATGQRLAVPRSSFGSKIDGTVGVLDWKSKRLVAVLPAHERPLARLDPGFGSQALHSSRREEIPMVGWLGDEVIVGALVRGDAEPRVGTGLTLHRIGENRRKPTDDGGRKRNVREKS